MLKDVAQGIGLATVFYLIPLLIITGCLPSQDHSPHPGPDKEVSATEQFLIDYKRLLYKVHTNVVSKIEEEGSDSFKSEEEFLRWFEAETTKARKLAAKGLDLDYQKHIKNDWSLEKTKEWCLDQKK